MAVASSLNPILSSIADALWMPEIDYQLLHQTVQSYQSLMLRLTGLNLEDEVAKENLYFTNGKAIGTAWAARCLDDMMRSKRFARGVQQAVHSVSASKSAPVHLLYAGTGPYATLVLPLLSRYTPKELQLTLLEINEHSFAALQQVLTKLEAWDYVKDLEQADASKYQIREPESVDILLSETMQHALVREQQVSILLNLYRQVRPEVILLPENIRLTLALMSSEKNVSDMLGNNSEGVIWKPLGTFFELNHATEQTYLLERGDPDTFRPARFDIPVELDPVYNQLCVLTEIQVFGSNVLKGRESSLTLPYILADLNQEEARPRSVNIEYVIGPDPYIQFEFCHK